MVLSQSERSLRWRTNNPEKHKEAYRKWAKNNRIRINAYMRKWGKDNPEKKSASHRKGALKKKYGLTLEDYEAILTAQGGHCALCAKTPEQERYGKLAVDHCHETGRIRGLLCAAHNTAIGCLGDNEDGILKTLKYIRGET